MPRRNEHSIEEEPFYQAAPPPAPGDSVRDEPGYAAPPHAANDDEKALHNVWDEPSFQAGNATAPPEAFTYSRWYLERLHATTVQRSWGVAALLALCGGPFAVVGTLLTSLTHGTTAGPLVYTVVAPALEEMMKIGALLIVLENRPYLFRSGGQLLLAAVASGYVFSAVENILYIYVYHPDGSDLFRVWRWTVCSALHTGTTAIAGIGLLHMWRAAAQAAATPGGDTFQRPDATHAYPYIITAVVIHGTYNGAALLMQLALGPM